MACGVRYSLLSLAYRFSGSRSGSIAIIFAFSLVPLIGVVGIAIDYSNIVRARSAMQHAADAAALGAIVITSRGGKKNARNLYRENSSFGRLSYYRRINRANEVSVIVRARHRLPLIFGQMIGLKKYVIKVESQSVAPMTLSSLRFRPIRANGWYNKTVRLMARRKGARSYKELMRMEYRYLPRRLLNISNSRWIDLSEYDSAYLQMELDPNSRGLSHCRWRRCNLTFRTDDPAWSQMLIIDRKRLPPNTAIDILRITPCGETSHHAWEDSGSTVSYANADFFYDIEGRCDGVSSELVRLVK